MSPIVREKKKDGDKNRAPELHAEQRTDATDASGGKSRQKVGATPRHGRGDTERYAAGHLLGLVLFYFEAEFGHDFLQVFPDVALGGGIAQ
jgi:hypothetical protein